MMRKTRTAAVAGIFALIASVGITAAVGQSAQTSVSMKTIGTPSAASKPDIVPSLFVMNSRGATLQGDTLVLTGVTPSSIIFADRPVRAAGHQPTADVIAEWGAGDDSFAKNPPNATVSVLGKDGAVKDAVVVLKTAKLEGDKLTFDVDVLEGDLAGGDGPAALFIDRFGFGGFHAGGFHAGGFGGFHAGGGFVRGGAVGVGRVGAVGVWHRPYVAHGAWYRGTPYAGAAIGAAAIGGAAVGAAAAGAYPYYGATCGYYPYPPCY